MSNYIEDASLARDIAYLKEKPEELKWLLTGNYCDYSWIFRVTNEIISSKPYVDTIKDKKTILSVIASGDQILNSVLMGSRVVDGFDISVFPKYYLKLKMAAVEALDVKDFREFFYGKHALNKDMYKKVSKYLEDDYKFFWDTLINYEKNKGRTLVESDLFCTDYSSINVAEDNNPYLEPSNYKALKSKIKNINLRLIDGDIFNLRDELHYNYDLVNLSSIVVANDLIPPTFDEQKKFFKGFKLNKNGKVLSYIFDTDYDRFFEGWGEIPNSEEYRYYDLYDKKGNRDDAILVYKRTK